MAILATNTAMVTTQVNIHNDSNTCTDKLYMSNTYIYIYIYIYIYACIHMHTNTYKSIDKQIYIYIYIHIYIHISLSIYIYIFMYYTCIMYACVDVKCTGLNILLYYDKYHTILLSPFLLFLLFLLFVLSLLLLLQSCMHVMMLC